MGSKRNGFLVDEWAFGLIHGELMGGWMDGWMGSRGNGFLGGWLGEWVFGLMDGELMDGWMDGLMHYFMRR
jgi:hypothetical protein